MTQWNKLTDEDRERAMKSMPDMLEGFRKTWGWLHFAKAIEDICMEKNAAPAPDVQPVAFRFKERPDDLRSAWLYVDKKKNVPRGFNCQHLYIIPQTKRNEEPVAWSIARVIEDDDGRPIGQDEPEVVWGRDRPEEDGFTPLYARPPAADVADLVEALRDLCDTLGDCGMTEKAHVILAKWEGK
jgi:hypothetical protein